MSQNWKKDIILFLTSQTISLFGSSLVQYAIMWYITLETQSGVMMTIFIICGFVPTFFLAPFAGVWADRYNRKVIIILSDTIIASVTLIMAVVFIMGYKEFWLLFTISAIRGLGGAVQMPTVNALIPQIVPEDKLMRVNGTNSSIQSLIMVISPIASGALLSMASIELIFFIDVATAGIAVLTLLLFLRVPPHAKALVKQKVSYYTDLREGFHYIRNHVYVRKFFIFCSLFFILVSPVAFLTPLQVARSFGNDVWRLTMIEITFSAGMIIGGIIMASWGGFRNKIYTMVLACLIMGAGTVALGFIPIFWLYNVVMAVVGLAMPMMNTPSTVLLQQKVEEEFLGRVFGVLSMISSSMMPLGMLVFGPLSDYFKIEWMLIGTGILMIVETILLLGNKAFIEIGRN
ncbi:MAG TPA: MFS transporter [Anaerovoracaceae bacterium]|nr:MFS transporter [Anaerovoracaceae bacterium]